MGFFLYIFIFLLTKISIGTIIGNSVYNLILNDIYYLSYHNNTLQISKSTKYEEKSNFRIKMSQNSSYIIEHSSTNLILIDNHPELKLINNLENDKINSEWFFIETNDGRYIIQNINKCFIHYKNNDLKCENINIKDASKFSIIKVYEEVCHSKEDLELIEKEPIDVIIKYIDLSDPDLKREGIPQIKKDEDNQELKYSVRSVLKNIPWVRKIFIILPNKKVRYFKDYELIKEKIVYVYDKDLIGFDSANICTFLFSYWKMENFNVSENIIIMDDDYFIGKPLKKSDFFYVENGKVVPTIIAKDFKEETEANIENNLKFYKIKASQVKGNQTSEEFRYTVYNTYKFILKILNKKTLLVPYFTHNAIPCNIKDIKEIYDYVYNSEFRAPTLESLYRGIEVLQFQTFYMTYHFNKYTKKVKPIFYNYVKMLNSMNGNYNFSLFVINTGGYDYEPMDFKKLRITMEKLFPEPTPYEIIDYSYFPSYAFDIVFELNKEINEIKEINNKTNFEIKSIKKEYDKNFQNTEKSKIFLNYICLIETIILIIIVTCIYKKSIGIKRNLIKPEAILSEEIEKKNWKEKCFSINGNKLNYLKIFLFKFLLIFIIK